MSKTFDFVVVGVGGFGSSTMFHLASQGHRVLGIEQHGIAHALGSSHGETRIIRQAYFEHVNYVPLLIRAYELWDELGVQLGRPLIHRCGLMLAGPGTSMAVEGTLDATRKFQLPVEELSASAARSRFPCYEFPDSFRVAFEQNAGFLDVEDCVDAHIRLATQQGAVLHTQEQVLHWNSIGQGVRITTNRNVYEAGRVIFTAGAWTSRLLTDLNVPLKVLRKPLYWFGAPSAAFDVTRRNPCFFFDLPQGQFYGFPRLNGRSIKVAEHTGGNEVADPSHVRREIDPDETRSVTRFLNDFIPECDGILQAASVCMYTMSPDQHFIIDQHPANSRVILGAGFSGHGFKFTTVLGQALADLAVKGHTQLPIDFLRLNRFRTPTV